MKGGLRQGEDGRRTVVGIELEAVLLVLDLGDLQALETGPVLFLGEEASIDGDAVDGLRVLAGVEVHHFTGDRPEAPGERVIGGDLGGEVDHLGAARHGNAQVDRPVLSLERVLERLQVELQWPGQKISGDDQAIAQHRGEVGDAERSGREQPLVVDHAQDSPAMGELRVEEKRQVLAELAVKVLKMMLAQEHPFAPVEGLRQRGGHQFGAFPEASAPLEDSADRSAFFLSRSRSSLAFSITSSFSSL